jgi:hypothetical protein
MSTSSGDLGMDRRLLHERKQEGKPTVPTNSIDHNELIILHPSVCFDPKRIHASVRKTLMSIVKIVGG